jgi:hypothetical protein
VSEKSLSNSLSLSLVKSFFSKILYAVNVRGSSESAPSDVILSCFFTSEGADSERRLTSRTNYLQ